MTAFVRCLNEGLFKHYNTNPEYSKTDLFRNTNTNLD